MNPPTSRPIRTARAGATRTAGPSRTAEGANVRAEGERLSKRVMALAGCSRSEAENYIDGGWVQVDGQPATNPATRVQQQTVTLDPQARLERWEDVTLVLHKPPGCTDGQEETAPRAPMQPAADLLRLENHWSGDRSGIRPAPRHFRQLRSMVPLESAGSGLLVFTQDWRRVRKLEEDYASIEHEWIFDVRGALPEGALAHMEKILRHSIEPLPASRLSISSEKPNKCQLRLAVKGSHPGLAAYLCAQSGLEIIGLRRIRLGRVALGALPVGTWCYLTEQQRF